MYLRNKMILKKMLFLLVSIIEWSLFILALLWSLLFNVTNLFNLIYVDMPNEEPVSFSYSSIYLVLALGLLIFICFRYITGNPVYEHIKGILWGSLLGLNFLWCIFWLFVGGFNYSEKDWILLLTMTVVIVLLLVQIFIKFRSCRKVIGS